jgi:signal transduction histidine kinase
MLVTERELVAGDRIELAGAIAIDVLARPPAGLAPEIELPRGIVRARGGDIPPTERVPREPLDALIDLEARLRDTEHRLGARIEAVERLAADRLALLAMAAHDVRTPLTVIVGYVAAIGDRLALEGGPAWLGEDLEAVGHAASGAADLLRDLLDRQRAELGKLELRPERGDLAALLAELAASYRRWAAIAGRRVALELLAPLPLVRFDRQRVVQIMNNLVHNGIKHAARGALVTIVARPAPPDAVEVAVENEGKGFDPSDTDRMLALFERGTSREPPIGEGHGVGLAIVKQLVELHGGRLTLSSLGGRGARFAFTLLVDGPRR